MKNLPWQRCVRRRGLAHQTPAGPQVPWDRARGSSRPDLLPLLLDLLGVLGVESQAGAAGSAAGKAGEGRTGALVPATWCWAWSAGRMHARA